MYYISLVEFFDEYTISYFYEFIVLNVKMYDGSMQKRAVAVREISLDSDNSIWIEDNSGLTLNQLKSDYNLRWFSYEELIPGIYADDIRKKPTDYRFFNSILLDYIVGSWKKVHEISSEEFNCAWERLAVPVLKNKINYCDDEDNEDNEDD